MVADIPGQMLWGRLFQAQEHVSSSVCGVRKWPSFIVVRFFQPLPEEAASVPFCACASALSKLVDVVSEDSGPSSSILYVHLCLGQHRAVLVIVALQCSLISGGSILCLFGGLMCFHINFRISSNSHRMASGIL